MGMIWMDGRIGWDGMGGRQRSQVMTSCLVSRLASIGVWSTHACIFSSGQGLAVTDLTTLFDPRLCFYLPHCVCVFSSDQTTASFHGRMEGPLSLSQV